MVGEYSSSVTDSKGSGCVHTSCFRVAQAIRFSVANFVMKNVLFLIPKYLELDMETV